MARVEIDGISVEMPDGATALDALRVLGVDIPTLCHDPRLRPLGACRSCLVRLEGFAKPVTACALPLSDGMRVDASSPEARALRRDALAMLARDYPLDAVRQEPRKEFHRWIEEYGILERLVRGQHETAAGRVAEFSDLQPSPHRILRRAQTDDTHPYFRVDLSRCIDCYRCVRICDEVQGSFVWQVHGRGHSVTVAPDARTMAESTCKACGACVDTCPTGALEDKNVIEAGTPTAWTRSTCPYCGVGCEMQVGTRSGRIVQILPAADAPVNKGHLCVKGRYAHAYVHAQDRVTTPLIRERVEGSRIRGRWRIATWEEAAEHAARQLQRLLEKHGPRGVGVLGSARSCNEDNYAAQKFARAVLGTNNVDCCARVCHGPTAAAMKAMLGTGAATNSFDDAEVARLFLVCGSNPSENHPIVGERIKQAVLRGAKLIVIDPRRIELTRYADAHLALNAGTNVALLNAMANVILEEGLADQEWLERRVEGLDEYARFVRDYSPERVAEVCGVGAPDIRKAARLYASVKPAMCFHGLGMTEHIQGTEGVMCLVNLALLTGNMGKPGTGINPLRGQNNVQGSAHMGCEPSNLTGFVSVEQGRELFEGAWGVRLPLEKGLNMLEMLDEAEAGRFFGLWAMGYDLYLTNANAHRTRKQLEKLDFLLIQDLFFNETAREFGDVFLPACSSFEREGTFMNAERRVQRVRKAIEPLGESKPDWMGVQAVARAMGKGRLFAWNSVEEIWNEVRTVWKAGAGMAYSRMEIGGLQWPCPAEDHPGTTILHVERFPIGERATLRRIPFEPTPERLSADYPLRLITGRNLYHFNAGTMTARTRNVEIHPSDTLDLSPQDAERLGLGQGQRVRVVSRFGEAVLPLNVDARVKPGEAFATFHTPELWVNRLTSSIRDKDVGTPEYKVTAVRVERA